MAEKNHKGSQGKEVHYFLRSNNKKGSHLLHRNSGWQKTMKWHIKMPKDNNFQTTILYLVNILIKNEDELNSFPTNRSLRIHHQPIWILENTKGNSSSRKKMTLEAKKWRKEWTPGKIRCEVKIKRNGFWLCKTMTVVFLQGFFTYVEYLHNSQERRSEIALNTQIFKYYLVSGKSKWTAQCYKTRKEGS